MSLTDQQDRASGAETEPKQEPRRTAAPWTVVALREIVVRLTDKAFIVGTLITIAIMVGLFAVQGILSERTSTYEVVATPDAVTMAETVSAAAPDLDEKVRVEVREVADAEAARAALEAEDADAWLGEGDDGWVLTGLIEVDGDMMSVASQSIRDAVLADNASDVGTTVDLLQAGSTVSENLLEGDAERQGLADALGFAMVMLFYLAALGFGFIIAGSVVEEKSSRIVEIITTKIPVRQLLAGKILGNVALAMGQTALFVGIGLVGLSFTEYSDLLPAASASLIWFLAFFLVGFVLLASLWAVAGSLASRSEDLQSTTMPLSMLTLVVFFGGLFVEGTWRTVASYVPPLSAVVMPQRLVEGTAEWWEPVASLVLLVVATLAVIPVAERLYRRSLLQTQGRVTLRSAWSAPE